VIEEDRTIAKMKEFVEFEREWWLSDNHSQMLVYAIYISLH
jgi:hypothetical protein